jgi:hypothetical protein
MALILSLLAPPRVYNVIAASNQENASQVKIQAARAYVIAQSEALGISPVSSTWIIDHESQDCGHLYGDDGQSLGCWQISRVYHPEVSENCAMGLICSTQWSLGWIKSGHINEWTSWACRYADNAKWAYHDATSTLGPAPKDYEVPNYCK